MKRLIYLAFTLLLAASLLTGCGGGETPQGSTTTPPIVSGSDSSVEPEGGENEAVTDGALVYDSDALLRSFSDYVYAQDMSETAVVKEVLNLETGEYTVVTALTFALLDANHCVGMAGYDAFMDSGNTLDGTPVTIETKGDEITWDTEKTVEVRESQTSQIGDVKKVHISLNTKTNTLISEEITLRGGQIVEKTVNKVMVLSDGTVLSEYYMASPSGNGDETTTSASVFKYNLKAGALTCISGTFQAPTADFTAPSCLTADDLDRDAYLAFADPVGTIQVSGGQGDLLLP